MALGRQPGNFAHLAMRDERLVRLGQRADPHARCCDGIGQEMENAGAREAGCDRPIEPRRSDCDAPWSPTSVCVVEGGVPDNIVPEACRVHYEFRNLPCTDAGAPQERVHDYAATLEPAMKAVDASSGIRFEQTDAMPEFEAKADEFVSLEQLARCGAFVRGLLAPEAAARVRTAR